MSLFSKIEKKDSISYDEFVSEHLNKRIPVVFKNATSVWKSNKMYTPDFFREKFGSYETTSGGVSYTMDEILKLTKDSTPENPAPYPVLFEIPTQLPELLSILDPIHLNYSRPNWFSSKIFPYDKFGKNIYLFIGGKGNQYVLHKDIYHTNAWITQLYGQKKFIVFPHGQDEHLYPGKKDVNSFLSPINVLNPDLEKYPDYKKATPIEVILEPGETIFIPNGVWHTTVGMGHNISFIFDQLNGSNFKSWAKDIYMLKKEQGLQMKANVQYAFALSVGALCKIQAAFGRKF